MGLKNISVSEGDTCIWEDGKPRNNIESITEGAESNEHITFNVGSGTYLFKVLH
jgi:hypothetical protein